MRYLIVFICLCLTKLAFAADKKDSFDALKYIDRELYAGVNSGFIFPSVERHSTSYVVSGEFHWGFAFTINNSFESSIYRYIYKENRILRDDRNNQEPALKNYEHIGLRVSLVHYTSEAIVRLYPLYEDNSKLLPYWSLGVSIEPKLAIEDTAHSEYAGDVYWGIGFAQGVGYLQVLPKTNWRLRYELGVLETYSPTAPKPFLVFVEPYIRLKFEYAFSTRQDFQSIPISVVSSPPLFEKNGKSIDELIANEVPNNSSFLFQRIISENHIINSNVQKLDEHDVDFKLQSQLLSLKGVVELNKISRVQRKREINGISSTYVIVGYARFLDSYLDMRADLDRLESKKYIIYRLKELARRRGALIVNFLINSGVKRHNISLSWQVVPEDSQLDGAHVSIYSTDSDIIIREDKQHDSITAKRVFRGRKDRFIKEGDIEFDLANQSYNDLERLLKGNNDAIDSAGDALASDTSFTVDKTPPLLADKDEREEPLLGIDDNVSESNQESIATEQTETVIDEETEEDSILVDESEQEPVEIAIKEIEADIGDGENIYNRFSLKSNNDELDKNAGYDSLNKIIVSPYNHDDKKDYGEDNRTTQEIKISDQLKIYKANEATDIILNAYVYYDGIDIEWLSSFNDIVNAIHNKYTYEPEVVKYVEIITYSKDNESIVNQSRIYTLRKYLIDNGIPFWKVKVTSSDKPISRNFSSSSSSFEYNFVANVIFVR